jgi:hypothetical protein
MSQEKVLSLIAFMIAAAVVCDRRKPTENAGVLGLLITFYGLVSL